MTRECVSRVAATALVVALGASAAQATVGQESHGRTDIGGLIVLELHGSYEEMGRQAVELLGETGEELRSLYTERWQGLVRRRGFLGTMMNSVVFPVWAAFGGWREDSGFFEEAAGIGRAAHARDSDGVRLLYGGVFGGGSTVFAATGSATTDGRAVIGRNVDWSDDSGRRRPVVTRYHPDNGDLVFMTASWPFIIVPIVGINEAGLAISINFFDADEMIGMGFPRIVYRRVLQQARTVEEALALLEDGGNRGGAGILVLADANGTIAVAECAATRCAIDRPVEDWLVRSNHARTVEMQARDEGRTADSHRRLNAMAAAVERHTGAITPAIAAEILRDRSNSGFINDTTVANLRVLNTVVVDPAARTLWHSTALQPIAPFGELVALAVDGRDEAHELLPADPRFDSGGLAREVEVVAMMRQAAHLFAAGRVGDAGRLWDRLAIDAAGVLEPRRLDWVRARVRWSTGRWTEAESLLVAVDVDAAPFEVRAYAKVARGMIADRQQRRRDALAHYEGAAAYLNAHAGYDAPFLVAPLRQWIDQGVEAPQVRGRMPAMPDLQCIPQ